MTTWGSSFRATALCPGCAALSVTRFVQSNDCTISSLKCVSQALKRASSLYYLASLMISSISVDEDDSAAV